MKPFNWEQMRGQTYPPEYMARVKQENGMQTELTAETLMVVSYELARRAAKLKELVAVTDGMTAALAAGVSDAGVRSAVGVLAHGQSAFANELGVTVALVATLATELARVKLREIKVE